jgi:hypothetical protein
VSAGQLAALIAAGFFAGGMSVGVFVLLRLARLISHAHAILDDYGDRAAALIEHAQAAVDRTHEQLTRTDSITASMDEVTANMAELSGYVSALAGLAQGFSAGLGAPLLRVAALAFGVRRAVSLRRAPAAAAAGPAEAVGLPSRPAAVPTGGAAGPAARGALPAGRGALTGQARLRGGLPGQRAGRSPGGRQGARP